ncbi:MAG: metal-dependent hydrolase [Betaproteobacteria bacterium RBG_16_56_24]|nr:MAG: metal-dependent hydrolase [Betaproteobacteria bacterium RBG_16_56_24]
MSARRVRDIEYQLLRSGERRTADIVIERNGLISVRVPEHLSEEQADAVVDHKRLWIYRNLAEWRDLNAARVVREWVNGEGFLYLGCAYRLLLTQEQDEPLKLKEGRFRLQRKFVEIGGEEAAKQVFEKFYTEKALERIKKRVAYFAPKVGVTPLSVEVRGIGYRWATCTPDGRLSFHWKCMMASPKVIDYIVVHELCHLRHRDHIDAFWNEVDKVMPDYAERKTWLRENGAALDI